MLIQTCSVDYKVYLFSVLSSLAYESEDELQDKTLYFDFDSVNFYDIDGAQAYCFYNNDTLIIACRGTESDDWNDIVSNIQAYPTKLEHGGRVHSGFKQEAYKIWNVVEDEITGYDYKEVYFCGHSLGGAIATILSKEFSRKHKNVKIKELYTYGSPRVGWRSFVKQLKIKHYRVVNNNDIVVKVPLALLGYCHHGDVVYINAYGNIRKMTFFQRIKDTFRGAVIKWKIGKISSLHDHKILEYVRFLKNRFYNREINQTLENITRIKRRSNDNL